MAQTSLNRLAVSDEYDSTAHVWSEEDTVQEMGATWPGASEFASQEVELEPSTGRTGEVGSSLSLATEEVGLDTSIGLIRGAGNSEQVIRSLLRLLTDRFRAVLLFRRAEHRLVVADGAGAVHNWPALAKHEIQVGEPGVLGYLATHVELGLGALDGAHVDHWTARQLVDETRPVALAMSIAIDDMVRYVILACGASGSESGRLCDYATLQCEAGGRMTRLANPPSLRKRARPMRDTVPIRCPTE